MIKILDSSYGRLGVVKNALSANRLETINGENTLDYSAMFDGRVAELVNEDTIYEFDNEYFHTALFSKHGNEDGTFTVDVETEHVSYLLNDPLYNVNYFTEIGLPSYILGKVLEGTGFTVGTVEFTTIITYSAQEAKSRRQLVMELVAYLGGEVSFNKFEISILTHRGSTEITSVIKDRNVKIVSKTVNKRQKDKDGNDLVSYVCTPIFIPGDSYSLGDNVVLLQKTIGLNEQLRVISISKNPYDEMETTFQFANYTNGLENSLFRIETNTIAKGKLYYGARISPEFGFESIRSDLKARTVMNADTFEMQTGDGTGLWYKRLWFDPELGLYIFDGTLSADTIEALKAEIDIVISNTVIVNNLTAEKGYIAELTVDQIDTSDKVQNYLIGKKDAIGYTKQYDGYFEFIDAQYKGDIAGIPQVEFVHNRKLQQLYWIDDTFSGVTDDGVTYPDYPVMQYQYNELIKMNLSHRYNSGSDTYNPFIKMGAGTGTGSRGIAEIEKKADGWYVKYTATGAGAIAADEEVSLSLTDDGVAMRPRTEVYVANTFPLSAQNKDLLVDTDDYSRYDRLGVTASVTTTQAEAEFIELTGTTSSQTLTITSPGATAGCTQKMIKNSSSQTWTIGATVDGIENPTLTTGSAMWIIWNNTDWRRMV